ncbi:MAG: HEAT repeat domain-containing protein, partial [Gemmatimonadetes bacterium]|nr:HEAT repeat domain-containing protein [Gemmatimonadota bacterium]
VESAGIRGGVLAERLGRLALGDAAPEVRIAALRALGRSRRKEALPDLAQFLEHGAKAEQIAAAEALADLGSARAAQVLSRVFERKRLFRKERGPLQEAAATALARLPLEVSKDTLRLLVADRNRRIARIATTAMEAGGADAVPSGDSSTGD